MKKALMIGVMLIAVAGCKTNLENHPEEDRPELPEGCVALYKHETGNDAENDDYQGIYCKTDVEVTKS